MVSMISKVLTKMEVLRGFIQIPTEGKFELIGDASLPCVTTLNGNPARLDKYGRIWAPLLKNKYSIGTRVVISKADGGYHVNTSEGEGQFAVSGSNTQEEIVPMDVTLKNETKVWCRVLEGDCLTHLNRGSIDNVCLTFFDPPYRQGKNYRFFDDSQPDEKYWSWIKDILHKVYDVTVYGGAIYFMQREKNSEKVLRVLRKTGWRFQNLIIWKKKTSAVPCNSRFSKQYQIIAYAVKGNAPRVFNKLRIDLPPLPEHKYEHENGVYLTDVWDDIRELTSGYFAGDEAIRDATGNRVHVQQSPVALLLRIILSSTLPGDVVLDPLAGSGTTLVVARQLERNAIGIEIDPRYVELIKKRLSVLRRADSISRYYNYYRYSPNLKEIWKSTSFATEQTRLL
jgi:DNA modification methylase